MIHFLVDMDDLTRIERDLGMLKDKSKMVLRGAINETAKQTVEMLIQEANAEYIIRQPVSVKKTLKIRKATVRSLEAIITSEGRVNELYNFSVNPRGYNPKNRPPGGHAGNVLRRNSPKKLYYSGGRDQHKAFTVKFGSGHITVGQRIPGSSRGAPNKFGKSAPPRPSHPNGEEAVKTLYSPSVPVMLGNEEGVYGAVNPKMYDALQSNIQQQIIRFLK